VCVAGGLVAGCGIPLSPEAQDALRVRQERRERAIWVLKMARDRGQELLKAGQADQAARIYIQMTKEALGDAGRQSDATAILTPALELAQAAATPKAKIAFLDNEIDRAIGSLRFSPILESGLPQGYPWPSMPGLIRVKRYPSSPIAWVGGSWQDRLFAALFERDRQGSLAMTIPVEFTLVEGRLIKQKQGLFSMSEYFRRQEQERKATTRSAISSGPVEKPILVVSLAMKGPYTPGNMEEPLAKLRQWLEEHKDLYEQVGHPRLLAYNSPLVWGWMKYSEVQIPIRKRQ